MYTPDEGSNDPKCVVPINYSCVDWSFVVLVYWIDVYKFQIIHLVVVSIFMYTCCGIIGSGYIIHMVYRCPKFSGTAPDLGSSFVQILNSDQYWPLLCGNRHLNLGKLVSDWKLRLWTVNVITVEDIYIYVYNINCSCTSILVKVF